MSDKAILTSEEIARLKELDKDEHSFISKNYYWDSSAQAEVLVEKREWALEGEMRVFILEPQNE